MRQATVVRYGQRSARAFGDLGDLWSDTEAKVRQALIDEADSADQAVFSEGVQDWTMATKLWHRAATLALYVVEIGQTNGGASGAPIIYENAPQDSWMRGGWAAAKKRAQDYMARHATAIRNSFIQSGKPIGPRGAPTSSSARGAVDLQQFLPKTTISASAGRGISPGLMSQGGSSSSFVGEDTGPGPSAPAAPMSDGMKVAIGLGTAALVVGGLWYFAG